jgi:hypothetical protein
LTPLLFALALAQAPADFTASELVGPKAARERDVVEFTLRVRNTGQSRPTYQYLAIDLPPSGLLASAPAGLAFDAGARRFEGPLDVEPGGEQEVRFALIAAPDSAGSRISPMATIRAEPGGTVLHASTEIEARRRPGEIVAIGGGVQVTRAGAWVLGFLAAGALFVLACVAAASWSGRFATRAAAAAFVTLIASGFLAIFAGLAREDHHLMNGYREASCTILDGGGRAQTETRRGRTSTTWSPHLAVRFDRDGRPAFGAGFDSPSRVRVGGRAALGEALDAFEVGSIHPCWYDPEDPARIVVRRGPGAAYFFAVLPLGLLAVGLAMLRSALRR